MGGDAEQPGGEAGLAPIPAEVLQRAEKGLLSGLFGILLLAPYPQIWCAIRFNRFKGDGEFTPKDPC
jgi:hypothetical protein